MKSEKVKSVKKGGKMKGENRGVLAQNSGREFRLGEETFALADP
jgi:hypothetical protein